MQLRPKSRADYRRLVAALAILCVAWPGLCAMAGEPAAEVVVEDAVVTVRQGTRPLLEYRYAEVPMKPCVSRWFTPNGRNILRDSPHDHKHHHAMMFAVAVEGVDFWSENAACGRQQHRSIERLPGGFVEQLLWTAPNGDRPLLRERRTIVVRRTGDADVSLVSWQSRLEPPPGKPSVTLTGAHYFGLGLRFVESMDKVGRFFNADGKPGEVVRGEERLVRSRWCAYTAPVDGKPVTVAVFDHPKNVRHPATIFTMPQHFAYLAATLNLWKEPMKVEAGEPLTLNYGVALWDGEVEAATVEKVYREWAGGE